MPLLLSEEPWYINISRLITHIDRACGAGGTAENSASTTWWPHHQLPTLNLNCTSKELVVIFIEWWSYHRALFPQTFCCRVPLVLKEIQWIPRQVGCVCCVTNLMCVCVLARMCVNVISKLWLSTIMYNGSLFTDFRWSLLWLICLVNCISNVFIFTCFVLKH